VSSSSPPARVVCVKSTWEDSGTPTVTVGGFRSASLDVCVGNIACTWVSQSGCVGRLVCPSVVKAWVRGGVARPAPSRGQGTGLAGVLTRPAGLPHPRGATT